MRLKRVLIVFHVIFYLYFGKIYIVSLPHFLRVFFLRLIKFPHLLLKSGDIISCCMFEKGVKFRLLTLCACFLFFFSTSTCFHTYVKR